MTESFSVVAASSCEIIYLSRESFCECLSGGAQAEDKDDLHHFIKSQQYYPSDEKLKQKYLEETDWQGFKRDIGKVYKNMRTTPQPKKPYQSKEFRYSPEKGHT